MINGRIKFLSTNKISVDNTTTITSDNTRGELILSSEEDSEWVSSIRNDTNVTIEMIFPAISINRIILLNHNLAEFSISGIFSNITDIDNNPLTSIDITGNEINTSYFAFSDKSISQLTLTAGATFPAMMNKRIGRVVFCTELGTFEGYPQISNMSFSNNSRDVKSKGGGELITKQKRTLKGITLKFNNYTKTKDIALAQTLHGMEDKFLIWPSGGDEGQFRFPVEGYRLQDTYTVQTKGDFRSTYKKGSYQSLISSSLKLVESI